MDNIILTPSQLWSEYDPYLEPLRPSYLDFSEQENFMQFEAYINGDVYEGENIRIYVHGCIPKSPTKNANIIFIGDYSFTGIDQSQLNLAKAGYGVFTFDYVGKTTQSKNYTRYPNSIKYANIMYAGDHLYKAEPTAKDACIYTWNKVCRKVISLVKQIRGDDSQVILTGFKHGADIAWQVAATDKRVNGIACLLNAGWSEYRYISKLSDEVEVNFDDERKRWFAGCSTQSYIKFVTCPVLCIDTTNSTITSIDRIEDTVSLLKKNNVPLMLNISAGLTNTVTPNSEKSYLYWLSWVVGNTNKLPNMPTIKFEKTPAGKLKVSAEIDKTHPIDKIQVFYSYDELDSSLRSWSSQLLSEAGLNAEIPVYDATKIVFAYVAVQYHSGVEISSLPINLHIYDSDCYDKTHIKKTRIIYQKNFGINGWVVEQETAFFDVIIPKISEGGLGISGITCDFGDLSTYMIGEYKYKSDNQNLLQFDAYTNIERPLIVCLCSGEFGSYDYFYSTISLKPSQWTKCSLKLQDFKNSNLVPLKEWENIKKLTFKDAQSVIFNNIIWV